MWIIWFKNIFRLRKIRFKVILVDKSFNYDYFISEGVDAVILRNNYGLKRLKLNKKYKEILKS